MSKIFGFIDWTLVGAICLLTLIYTVYYHADMTLEYIRVIKWPALYFATIIVFKNEISVLATEKLRSFFIKVLGVELQGNLADQKSEIKNMEAQDNIDSSIVVDKEKELSTYIDLKAAAEIQRALAVREIELDFERIYNRIFGTQFSLLENLIVAGGKHAFLYVEEMYKAVQNANPVFNEWSIETYLNFLFRNSLIERGENMTIDITDKGRSFVQYIRNGMRYGGYKPL